MGTQFPLLLIPVIAYNLVAFLVMTGVGAHGLTQPWFVLPMTSPGARWIVSLSDLFVLGGLICLFFEVLKSTSSANSALMNHVFAMFVFITALVEFLLLPRFANSTFFLLVVMAALDVMAGFIVTTISARKDLGAGG